MQDQRNDILNALSAVDRGPEVIAGVKSIILPEISSPITVAKFLNLSLRSIYSMLATGEIPGRKIRRRWFIEKTALLEALRPEPSPPLGPRLLPRNGEVS